MDIVELHEHMECDQATILLHSREGKQAGMDVQSRCKLLCCIVQSSGELIYWNLMIQRDVDKPR